MVTSEALQWRGRDMVDRDDDKIGSIEEIYLDTDTDRPEWALVNTGLFGLRSSFVPLHDAQAVGDRVRVPYGKDQVKDAPSLDTDEELSVQEEEALYRHYGMDYLQEHSVEGLPGSGTEGDRPQPGLSGTDMARREGAAPAGTADAGLGRDVRGGGTDDAMTRSEEELDVRKSRREAGRARLRKYVVTDEVTKTVPVQREELRVEREPITEENVERATSGPAISEDEHEVVLHEEEVEVEKRAVPKERVRLDKDTVVDEERVSDQVRKEQIDMDAAEEPRGPRG